MPHTTVQLTGVPGRFAFPEAAVLSVPIYTLRQQNAAGAFERRGATFCHVNVLPRVLDSCFRNTDDAATPVKAAVLVLIKRWIWFL